MGGHMPLQFIAIAASFALGGNLASAWQFRPSVLEWVPDEARALTVDSHRDSVLLSDNRMHYPLTSWTFLRILK